MAEPAYPVQSAASLGYALIGAKTLPPGLAKITEQAGEAWAYHRLQPYPTWAFRTWKVEERGPLPWCLPIARSIGPRGARWLFGRELTINASSKTLEKLLRDAWTQNRMPARLRAIAEQGALEGGVALKFAYDGSNKERPLSIQSLSLVNQVRCYYHPHDRDQLLMVRVQYPYFDAAQGCTFWYREEWTAGEEVHYQPVRASELGRDSADTYEGWQIASLEPNPFGVIPITPIRNIETDDAWGCGDLWELYRICDRINLVYYQMDRSNQFDSQLNPIFIDAKVNDEYLDSPLAPGQPILVESNDASGAGTRQAKVEFPSGGNGLRDAMLEYAKDLRKQFLTGAGSVEIDPADVTNKGNLTQAVLQQLYAPQIETTADKRRSWGDDGLCRFFATVRTGLANLGGVRGISKGGDSQPVTLDWPAYVELGEDEKAQKTTRIASQVSGGFLDHERGVREISQMEERPDVDAIVKDLADVSVAAGEGTAAKLGPPPPPTLPGGGPPVKPTAKTKN